MKLNSTNGKKYEEHGSISVIIFIVFLVLKLTNTISWSWVWVTSPLWIPFLLIEAILIIVWIVLGLTFLFLKE